MALPNKTITLPSSSKRRNWFYAVFIAINLFLSCYYLDIWITPNTASRAVTVMSLQEDKSLVIDKYAKYAVDISKINGHYYSNKAPLTSFMVYPFYWLYKDMGLPRLKDSTLKKYPIYIYENIKPDFDGRSQLFPESSPAFILGDIVCGAIPFVIILVLSLFAIKKTNTKVSPVVVVMFTFYAAFLFAYAGTYTGHLLAGFFALTGYILLKKKNYVFSGLMVGLAMVTEYPVGVLIPVWAILIYLNEKKISKPLLFSAGIIPALLFVLYYNYHLTGSLLKTSYSFEIHQHKQGAEDVGFYFPKLSAFWGLVFSTYRGVLYYTPVLLLVLWYGIKYGYENVYKHVSNKTELVKSGMKNYFLVTILAYMLLYSAYYEWAGGWSYGPRYLIPLVVIVLYEGVLFLSSRPFSAYAFYIIAGIGIVFTWMDKSTKIFEIPSNPANAGNPIFDILIPDFFKHKFNTNTLPVLMFNSNPVIAVYAWPILFMAGMLILTVWYTKLYPTKKSTLTLFIPIIPLLILYVICIVPQSTSVKNKLSLDYSGIFGGWKYLDKANIYALAAQDSKAPKRKVMYYDYAAQEYKKVLEFAPKFQEGYIGLGLSYSGEGYQDSATTAYKKVLEINPKFSMASKYLGIIYLRKKLYDTAIYYFMMSYKADSNLGSLENIGAAYQLGGNNAQALHFDSLALQQNSNNKSIYGNMSIIHDDMGLQYLSNNELDKALSEFSMAQKLDSDFAKPLRNIGIVYQKKGNIAEAKYYYEKALIKDPKNEVFAKNLQVLNKKKK